MTFNLSHSNSLQAFSTQLEMYMISSKKMANFLPEPLKESKYKGIIFSYLSEKDKFFCFASAIIPVDLIPFTKTIFSYLSSFDRAILHKNVAGDLSNMSCRIAKKVISFRKQNCFEEDTYLRRGYHLKIYEHFNPQGPSIKILTCRGGLITRQGEEWIQKRLINDLTSLKVITDINTIETTLNKKCFFYHGTQLSTVVFMLFYQIFFSSDAPLLRLPDPQGPSTIKEFLDRYPHAIEKSKTFGFGNDYQEEIRAELLSVNPSLFSNPDAGSECTWQFYYTNLSAHPPDCKVLFNALFDRYELLFTLKELCIRKYYIERLSAFYDELKQCAQDYFKALGLSLSKSAKLESRGAILQITVPEDLVDAIAYPSKAGGVLQEKVPSLLSAMKQLYIAPQSNDSLFLQARLLAQSLLVEEHGIAVYIHGYGQFFDSKLPPDNDSICKELLIKRDAILAEVRKLFAVIILQSPASTPEGALFSILPQD